MISILVHLFTIQVVLEYTQESIARSYENQNIGDKIVKKIEEVHDRKSILVAVPTIEQATDLPRKIPMKAVVHGGTPKKDRDRIIEEFRNQQIRVIVQVNVLTVGFDYPELDCLITGRPTSQSHGGISLLVEELVFIHKKKIV